MLELVRVVRKYCDDYQQKKKNCGKPGTRERKKEDFLVLFDQGENERELELIVPILQKLEQLASLPCSRSLPILLLPSPISQPVNTLISWQVFPPKKKTEKKTSWLLADPDRIGGWVPSQAKSKRELVLSNLKCCLKCHLKWTNKHGVIPPFSPWGKHECSKH